MKKGLLLSLAALALAGGVTLSACGGGTSTSADSTSSGEASSSGDTSVLDTSITFTGSSSVEVGATTTIRALYSASSGNSLVSFTVDDETVLQLPSVTESVASISVTGLKVGTATITATSVEDPTRYNTFTIEVVAARDSLQTALSKIAQYTNYTVTGRPVSDDLVTDATTSVLKRTEKAYTLTMGDGSAIWLMNSSTAVSTGYASVYGMAVDSEGYAGYLTKDITSTNPYVEGDYNTNPERISGDEGFLTADDFAGSGANASSPSATLFTTLANINYAWAPSGKNSSNTYTIEGSEDDTDAAYLECVIWNLCDATGMMGVMRANNSYYYYDAATYIDTTVTVNADGTVDFKITPKTGTTYKASSDSTAVAYEDAYMATISDIGTTTLDDDTTALLSNSEFSTVIPELESDLASARNALLAGNYVENVELGTRNGVTVEYDIYYTEDYVLYDYDAEFIANYKTATGSAPAFSSGTEITGPIAYINGSDGYLHQVMLNTSYEVTSNTIISSAGGGSLPSEVTSGGVTIKTLQYNFGYYEYTNFEQYNNGYLWYSLSSYNTIWGTSYGYYYYTSSKTTGLAFALDGYDGDYIDLTGDGTMEGTTIDGTLLDGSYTLYNLYSGIQVETTDSAVSTVTFMMGMQYEESGYYTVYFTTYTDFGSATTNNGHATLSALTPSTAE